MPGLVRELELREAYEMNYLNCFVSAYYQMFVQCVAVSMTAFSLFASFIT